MSKTKFSFSITKSPHFFSTRVYQWKKGRLELHIVLCNHKTWTSRRGLFEAGIKVEIKQCQNKFLDLIALLLSLLDNIFLILFQWHAFFRSLFILDGATKSQKDHKLFSTTYSVSPLCQLLEKPFFDLFTPNVLQWWTLTSFDLNLQPRLFDDQKQNGKFDDETTRGKQWLVAYNSADFKILKGKLLLKKMISKNCWAWIVFLHLIVDNIIYYKAI